MFTSTKTILKLFTATALVRANTVLKNSSDLNELVDSASKEIESGKKKINSAREELLVIISMLKSWAKGDYKVVPWTSLALCAGALIYFVNPFDAVPDLLPGIGLLDDATVVGFVLASIKKDVQKFKTQSNFAFSNSQMLATN